MNYFDSTEAIQLFNCPKEHDSIEDCLSHQIDIFDKITNHKQKVHLMVNKANEEYCELITKQEIIILMPT